MGAGLEEGRAVKVRDAQFMQKGNQRERVAQWETFVELETVSCLRNPRRQPPRLDVKGHNGESPGFGRRFKAELLTKRQELFDPDPGLRARLHNGGAAVLLVSAARRKRRALAGRLHELFDAEQHHQPAAHLDRGDSAAVER